MSAAPTAAHGCHHHADSQHGVLWHAPGHPMKGSGLGIGHWLWGSEASRVRWQRCGNLADEGPPVRHEAEAELRVLPPAPEFVEDGLGED